MWNDILNQVVDNLQKVGIGIGIFVLMYISNMGASIWYNVKILSEKFSWSKIKDSGIKVLCISISIICFCLGVTLVLPWINYAGLEIPQEFNDVLNIVAMCGVALSGIVKYGKEAFTKLQKIFKAGSASADQDK